MMRYSIMGRECGADHAVEVCRVGTNPEQVAAALKGKVRVIRQRQLKQYDLVYVVDHGATEEMAS